MIDLQVRGSTGKVKESVVYGLRERGGGGYANTWAAGRTGKRSSNISSRLLHCGVLWRGLWWLVNKCIYTYSKLESRREEG